MAELNPDYVRAQNVIREWEEADNPGRLLVFTNLNIDRLPPLPDTLIDLRIHSPTISHLTPLPPNLLRLVCDDIHIDHIPHLPDSLQYFHFTIYRYPGRQVSLPDRLPSNLVVFDCNNIIDDHLPGLPASLQAFITNGTNITTLPELPDILEVLIISNSPLTNLPERLPTSLRSLIIYNTQIKELPAILPSSLTDIDISNTKIKKLPDIFPETLTRLVCDDCPYLRSRFPDEPVASYHACVKNKERFLKDIPEYVEDFVYSKRRMITRCKAIKEDLMAATWHTDRVLDWCDPKAFDFDD